MSIDPRMMKQLLQLQLQPNLGGLTASPKQTGDSDFLGLLLSVMGQAEDSATIAVPTGAAGSAAGNLQRLSAAAPIPQPSYDPMIREAASRFGVDASLVKAVVERESSFNPYAVSRAGAKGLMQLTDETAREVGVTDPFDAAQNLNGGTRYLAKLLARYDGNEAVALAAYNAGPGRVDALGIRTDAQLSDKLGLLPEETRRYVANVLERRQAYRETAGSI